ncbi:MAG: diol dehydratase small subunit [Anaerolineales bacterium]|nr:diol dehydratase small subunit [Anaerolineales bacterium]
MSEKAVHYPLIDDEQAEIRAASGRPLAEITVDAAMAEELAALDLRISRETLRRQAEAAEAAGYPQLAHNLRRAAELIDVPNDELLRMYNALRPHRSTYDILQALAQVLEHKYQAPINAAFVREAADVYRERGLLRKI